MTNKTLTRKLVPINQRIKELNLTQLVEVHSSLNSHSHKPKQHKAVLAFQ